MNWVLVGVFAYVAVQFAIGMAVSRRIRDEADYLLAGRQLGYSLATFSFFATWFGAETCVSSAGGLYESGLAGGSAEPFGYAACILLMGVVFAVPLWKRGLTTIADLYRERFSTGVERLAVIVLVPTSILWAAAQIRAFGQVLSAVSGGPVLAMITVAAALTIIYTASGGLRADVITDLVQGVMIIVGLVALLFAIVQPLGGFSEAWGKIDPARFKLFDPGDGSWWNVAEAWAIPIFGSVVAQELVARVAGSRSRQVAQRSAIAGGGLYLLIGLIPAFIGLVGVQLLPDLKDPEQLLPTLAQKHLSTFLYVLFAGALISAILSTVDSSLLAASALVEHNLIAPFTKGITEAGRVCVARWGVAAGGVIAWLLAVSTDSIYELVEASSAFGGGGLFVLLVMGLFSKFGGVRAGWAASIVSILVWVGATMAGWAVAFVPSLIAAAIAYFIAGLFDRRAAVSAPR
jgi:solute:Na+ symporter, SSS family